MSAFEGEVLNQTVAVARQHKIEPEALLAVVEVESAGKSLEIDGKTPSLLFERHIFYRELKKAGKTAQLNNAVLLGLANSSWQPKTQYKDQGTSAKRLTLLAKARAVDEECADRSCSWGVGQTMGFLAEELHFANARMMLAYMVAGGVPAQVECMVREIENHKLTAKLNSHDWAGFARSYNGPGYATNHYDTKMADAYRKWINAHISKVPMAPAPVIAPTATTPQGPSSSMFAVKSAGAGTGVAAGGAGIWAALQFFPIKTVVIVLIATGLVAWFCYYAWKKYQASLEPETGVLTEVEGNDYVE